jgi:hypothetical protein
MVWLFLAVALVLAVLHPGFRKVVLWGMPIWLIIAFLIGSA